LLSALFCAQLSWGQNPWEEGRNVAGEAAGAALGQSGDAYIGGRFTSGGFRNLSEAKTGWAGETQAEGISSYKNLYMKGNFGFELYRGSEMMGSMFVEPGFYPLDVLEFTPGTKVRQTYDVGGGLAWKNDSPWTMGGVFRFRGVNYAKRKDLRHTTYRQELECIPSLHYKADFLQLGLSALVEKNSEFIIAEQVGLAQATNYWAFLDKGLRYGNYQIWDSGGIHLKEAGVDRMPVTQQKIGAAVQTSLGDLFYGDIEYRHSFGSVGEKGYTWLRFYGNEIAAKVIFTLKKESATHILRTDYTYEQLNSFETVLDKVTVGGVTTPREYGSNLIFRKRAFSLTPSYQLQHKDGWTLWSAVSLIKVKELSTLSYPYYDDDRSTHLKMDVTGMVPVGRFVLQAGVSFIHLIGSHGHFMDEVDKQIGLISQPYHLEEWKKVDDLVDDATKLNVNGSVRYLIGKGLYAEAGCLWLQAFNVPELPGNYRQTTYIKMGYNF